MSLTHTYVYLLSYVRTVCILIYIHTYIRMCESRMCPLWVIMLVGHRKIMHMLMLVDMCVENLKCASNVVPRAF